MCSVAVAAVLSGCSESPVELTPVQSAAAPTPPAVTRGNALVTRNGGVFVRVARNPIDNVITIVTYRRGEAARARVRSIDRVYPNGVVVGVQSLDSVLRASRVSDGKIVASGWIRKPTRPVAGGSAVGTFSVSGVSASSAMSGCEWSWDESADAPNDYGDVPDDYGADCDFDVDYSWEDDTSWDDVEFSENECCKETYWAMQVARIAMASAAFAMRVACNGWWGKWTPTGIYACIAASLAYVGASTAAAAASEAYKDCLKENSNSTTECKKDDELELRTRPDFIDRAKRGAPVQRRRADRSDLPPVSEWELTPAFSTVHR